MYNAVDLTEFSAARDGLAVRTELGIAPDRPVVVLVGAVQHVKGHWLVLDAFTRRALEQILALWRQPLSDYPADGIAAAFVKRIESLQSAPTAEWTVATALDKL